MPHPKEKDVINYGCDDSNIYKGNYRSVIMGEETITIKNINTLCDYYLREPKSAESIVNEIKANSKRIIIDIPKHSLLSKIRGIFK